MLGEQDISWPLLARVAADWAGDSSPLAQVIPLQGGSVNTTMMLKLADGRQAVLKISSHRINPELTNEAYQLTRLREFGLPVPAVLHLHVASFDNPHSYLVIEYVDGMKLSEARQEADEASKDRLQEQLADIAAKFHSHTSDHCGKLLPDGANGTPGDWPGFFRSLYDPCWRETQRCEAIPLKMRKKIGKLHDNLEEYLVHDDPPRLLHGDLWCGNILCQKNDAGEWNIVSLIDPNCRFGHAESEIAYLDLFQTITPTFKKQYQNHYKLTDDYHKLRKPIYQLYPLISHVNFFGPRYVTPLMKIAEQATAVV